jgi:hypothetical protein
VRQGMNHEPSLTAVKVQHLLTRKNSIAFYPSRASY